ncbi:hypothetical protein Taro_031731 [Colocasia esculenta]|uniref:Uncharacterized protein n=1 Tax=Colocasia esculenta TaxID=4460 RepID=A0A843W1S9_COLES|nr:hypothetical protein [Colocasia esculenta]
MTREQHGGGGEEGDQRTTPLLASSDAVAQLECRSDVEQEDGGWRKVWAESKKLWRILGPAIFIRLANYSMNVITQAFAGHLGDLELAAMSIAYTVIVGFNFGLMEQSSKDSSIK